MSEGSLKTATELTKHTIRKRLCDICRSVCGESSNIDSIWFVVERHYSEPHRAYHNLTHIQALLALSASIPVALVDPQAVDLAIIFHDIIYDPKSKTNEEDSAALFKSLFPAESPLRDKVIQYIIETKKHSVLDSNDNDLKWFIDFDMSIVGSAREDYIIYARQIRQEYSFVPEEDYCRGRAAVLRTFLNGGRIFATEECYEKWEAQARANIEWECSVLSSGRLV